MRKYSFKVEGINGNEIDKEGSYYYVKAAELGERVYHLMLPPKCEKIGIIELTGKAKRGFLR